jgi:hypothetical protein
MNSSAPIDSRTGVTAADAVADAVHAMLTERFGDSAPRVSVHGLRAIRIEAVPAELVAAWFRGRGVDADIVAAGLPVQERDQAVVTPAHDGGALLSW